MFSVLFCFCFVFVLPSAGSAAEVGHIPIPVALVHEELAFASSIGESDAMPHDDEEVPSAATGLLKTCFV